MKENGNLSLRVLTHNIHKGFSSFGSRFVLDTLKEEIESTGADCVFLQEIQGEHKRRESRHENWPRESQFEFLADRVWPHFAYGKNALYRAGHHGNAILCKYPIEEWENVDVSLSSRVSRSILHAVIPINGIRLHCLCIHFGFFELERKNQLRELVRRVHNHVPDDEPLIVAGDFNDWRGRLEDNLRRELGLEEAFLEHTGSHAKTFPTWLPVFPLDRVYYRKLTPRHCSRLDGKKWRKLSDHYPLLVDFS